MQLDYKDATLKLKRNEKHRTPQSGDNQFEKLIVGISLEQHLRQKQSNL